MEIKPDLREASTSGNYSKEDRKEIAPLFLFHYF
jgi:hypothetical protein